MTKGKNRPPRGPHIKNANLIGAGSKIPVVKDDQGNREWAKGVRAVTPPPPSPQVKESNLQQAAKTQTATPPAKPATKPPTVNVAALKASTSLTPPANVMRTKSPNLQKGASQLLASQKQVKPAVKSPTPVKKPPTPGR